MGVKKDDIYIEVLKYGRNNLENGVRLVDLVEYLNTKDYNVTSNHSKLRNIFLSTFSYNNENATDENFCYFLTLQSYFHLLEYEKAQDARAENKHTRTIAIISVVVAIITMILSIIAIIN